MYLLPVPGDFRFDYAGELLDSRLAGEHNQQLGLQLLQRTHVRNARGWLPERPDI